MTRVRIGALHVYPVKSCGGIAADAVRVERTGFALDGVRDREWMIVDGRGRFVTQREHPELALIATRIRDGALEIDIPGAGAFAPQAAGAARDVVVWNASVRGFDAGDTISQALSGYLGTTLRLVRFDDDRPRRCNPDYAGDSGATTLFSDGYPVLVIGQASLDALNARLDARGIAAVPMDRFRPNLVVDGLDAHDEDHVATLGAAGVTLRLVKPCTRCEITTTDQRTAHRGVEPLRTLSTYRRDDRLAGVTFGMNAVVVSAGELRRGDEATVDFAF